MSAVILAYAVAYAVVHVVATHQHAEQGPIITSRWVGLTTVRLSPLVAFAVPLVIATWWGHGALQPVAPAQADGGTPIGGEGSLIDLAGTFLVPLLAVIGTVVLVRYGIRWLLPLLAGQGLILVMAGTRAMIVIACVLTLVGAAVHGVRPSRRQVAVLLVMVSALTALISSTRVAAGREVFHAESGAEERISGLVDGARAIGSSEAQDGIAADLVYRFDGNTFGAQVYTSIRGASPPVGLTTVGNNMVMLVPRVIAPNKVASRSLIQRSEEAYLASHVGLSQHVDWLPTMFGVMVAYFGAVGLFLLAVLLALAMAGAERTLSRALTPARVVALIGLAQCALLYASGPQVFLVTLRSVVALVLVVWAVATVLRRRAEAGRHRQSEPTHPFHTVSG
ncbi:hypothetical protein [Micromonospora sp. KC723]|uniref:hypothetical protein n=1 Tax=Micromonospora sp. KC723 TaxID=2530381 RepID=UPI0010485120|nr:hypothetical protein [Micromonospora sp. KC723]TDB78358.1 hypothetical protein E1165_01505 [Micromonospora sp. KC723]